MFHFNKARRRQKYHWPQAIFNVSMGLYLMSPWAFIVQITFSYFWKNCTNSGCEKNQTHWIQHVVIWNMCHSTSLLSSTTGFNTIHTLYNCTFHHILYLLIFGPILRCSSFRLWKRLVTKLTPQLCKNGSLKSGLLKLLGPKEDFACDGMKISPDPVWQGD